MLIIEPRASAIIFNYLTTNHKKNKFYLIPVNTCPIVPITFMKAGVPYELIDINISTLCIDENIIEEYLKNYKLEGILFINTYGKIKNNDKLFKHIKKTRPDVKIIEDKCLNIPNLDYNNTPKYADIELYSTGYSKYVDIGYGGYALCKNDIQYKKRYCKYNNKHLEKIEKRYKNSISQNKIFNYTYDYWLDNSDLKIERDEYMGRVNEYKNKVSIQKKNINNIYRNNLPEEIIMEPINSGIHSWRFNILVSNKKDLLKEIFDNGLFASGHYKPLDGIFSDDRIYNSVAGKLYEKVVNLFNDFNINSEQALKLTKIINKKL